MATKSRKARKIEMTSGQLRDARTYIGSQLKAVRSALKGSETLRLRVIGPRFPTTKCEAYLKASKKELEAAEAKLLELHSMLEPRKAGLKPLSRFAGKKC
jgi:hypothetical protein